MIRAREAAGLVLAALVLAVVFAGSGSAAQPTRSTYIVVLQGSVPSVPDVARDQARRFGGDLQFVYTHALKGYAASLPDSAIAAIARLPIVDYVEANSEYTTDATESPVTWGLDRIDQRNRPLSNSFTYANAGAGVTAYIIDTGIRLTHSEFGGRAVTGYDAVTAGGSATDCNGHGTHVAGTVGGSTYGVAKAVGLVAVRVLDCNGSGTTAQVVAGIDWVTGHHASPAVANMSLGGGASTALDTAVRNSIASGVSYSIAAGNGFLGLFAQNACNTSPARVTEAMTVSATDSSDRKPSWANVGTCVDWFAPGVSVTSAWNTSDTATNTISGTSMATPHTTGVAALYLQANPLSTPAQVQEALRANATGGVVVSPGSGSPNKLLFTNY